MSKISIGKLVPDIEVQATDEQKFKLSDLYLGHSHIPLRGSSLFSEKSSKLSSYGIPQLAAGYSEK